MEKTEGRLSLIAANAVTALCAVLLHWPLYTLLWPFWIQSVIIGWYSGRRILALRHFSTENFKINDQPVPPTRATQVKTVTFFAVHYGIFHLVYLVFISGMAPAFGWALPTSEP